VNFLWAEYDSVKDQVYVLAGDENQVGPRGSASGERGDPQQLQCTQPAQRVSERRAVIVIVQSAQRGVQ
jgi:hypothetical protein